MEIHVKVYQIYVIWQNLVTLHYMYIHIHTCYVVISQNTDAAYSSYKPLATDKR